MGRLLQEESCKNGSPAFAGLPRNKTRRGCSACFTLKQHGPESVRGFTLPKQRERFSAFTLAELLVTMGVLALLVFLFTQLLNNAATTMTLGNKRMDADSQARQLLDRMAIDFDQMLKRSDVSYYVKTLGNTQAGNDQIAFFSAVPGYYSQAAYNSNASLVAYRVNADPASISYNKLERLGKGLIWNGASTTDTPAVFLPLTISTMWPYAIDPRLPDTSSPSAYEVIGPDVFRCEYYYLLSSSPSVGTPNQLSAGPWTSTDTFSVKDVEAIVVAIAVIDPRSRVLLTTANMEKLAGTNGQTSPLVDYTTGWIPGQLLSTWQTALDGITAMPRPAISGVRLYERYFYLNQ